MPLLAWLFLDNRLLAMVSIGQEDLIFTAKSNAIRYYLQQEIEFFLSEACYTSIFPEDREALSLSALVNSCRSAWLILFVLLDAVLGPLEVIHFVL